jgi:hypothetical protein
MFQGFIEWLDAHLTREEPSAIVKSVIGLLTFAGLLGTIFGNQAIRVGAFVVVIMFVLSVMLLLMADRRRLKRDYEVQRAQLARYCDDVIDNTADPEISIEHWRQSVYVRPNGDVREVLNLKAVALMEKVHFVRLSAGSRWDQPEKYRRDVKVVARSITANGTPGPHWNVTTSWQSTRKIISIPHLRQAISRGEDVTFEVMRHWPGKCLPLMRGREAEDFTLRTTNHLQVQSIEYRVVLPRGFDAIHELIGSTEPDVTISAETEYDEENRKVLVWRSGRLPTATTVGMRIELI